jgi:hypothetical protein
VVHPLCLHVLAVTVRVFPSFVIMAIYLILSRLTRRTYFLGIQKEVLSIKLLHDREHPPRALLHHGLLLQWQFHIAFDPIHSNRISHAKISGLNAFTTETTESWVGQGCQGLSSGEREMSDTKALATQIGQQ